jgi:hypothetical protein
MQVADIERHRYRSSQAEAASELTRLHDLRLQA